MSLEDRVQRLEDLAAIDRLFSDYRRCLDERDYAGYANLFTEDGTLIADNIGTATGRADIKAMLDVAPEENLGIEPGSDYHLVANPTVDLDPSGDRATARVTWGFIQRGEGDRPVLSMLGHYDDVLVKVDGRWYFQVRDARSDVPA